MSRVALSLLATAIAIVGCARGGPASTTAPSTRAPARWSAFAHVARVLDLSTPRADGSITVATAGRLALLHRGGGLTPFAPGYSAPAGEEPYIALSPGRGRCSFGRDSLYALTLGPKPGVTVVDASGRVRSFVALATQGLPDGIAFDTTGRFRGRLLVTAAKGSATTVFAIDCRRHVSVLTRRAPKVEGGIAVAPAHFGRFGGDLIAPDENSGRIYAIAPSGKSRLVADSGLPHGGDVGVESAGFVPRRFHGIALVADRATPGNPHPGDDVILAIGAAALKAAGVRGGDLLIATEGGAQTDAVTCAGRCHVRHVADGPAVAHLEGHIAFAR